MIRLINYVPAAVFTTWRTRGTGASEPRASTNDCESFCKPATGAFPSRKCR